MLILAVALSSVTAVVAASPAPSPAPSPRPSPRASAAPPVAAGTVRGPDGKPVAGARVIVSQERLDIAVAPASAKTDASGQFRLPLRSGSAFTLRVEAPGLAARTLRHQVPGPPIAVLLARGTTIEGFVRETTSGTPVPGATVEAREEARGASGLAWDPDSGVVRTTTDAKGAYRLEGLASGLYTVTAVARGLGRAERRGAPAGRPADLLLTTGGAVSGAVTDAGGKPVEGAILRLTSALPMTRDQVLLARTDARGAFAIYGAPAGEYRVVGRHPDFAPAISPPVTLDRDSEAHADLVLSRPGTVRGRLVGPGEKPTRGHATVKEIAGVDTPDVLAADLTAEAGDDGVFTLRLGPGSHSLELKAPGHGLRRLDVESRGADETVDLGDVALEIGITIRGHVRDAANRPVENAQVWTYAESDEIAERSDAAGAYVLAGLPPGMYTIVVTAAGTGRAQRKAEAGASGIDFVLQPAGRIAGRVVDEAGRPIEAFRVQARPRARSGYGPMTRDNFSGDDGRFLLEEVAEGEYVVDVSAPDRAPSVVSDVKVAPGGTADLGTIRLSAGGIVRGLVVDATSAPVAGAIASISGMTRDSSRLAPEVTTDAGGAFEFRGVPPGAAQVTVTHPSYSPGTATGLDVDPARGPVETRVVLSQGGRIEGRVRARSGVLPVGAAVYVSPARSGMFAFVSGPPMQSVAPDGTFVVEHVPVGRANVTLLAGRQGDFRSVAQVDAEVRDAETTTVDLVLRSIAVSGKVVRGGAPVAGARVEIESAHGGMWFGGGSSGELPANVGITADDGTYHLTLSEGGEASPDILMPDRKTHLPVAQLQVPDADSFVADFSFSGTFIEGVVLDRDTEQGVAGAYVSGQAKDPGRGGSGGSYAQSDAEGRFHLELDPGEYLVNARAEGYGGDAVPVTLGESGITGVRVVVVQGLTIKGKIVDGAGRGVGGVAVRGTTMEAPQFNVGGRSLPDGSFELSGLRAGRYVVAAGSEGLFAIVPGLTPGARPVTLALRPGGRVRVRVLGTDGAPAAAYVRISGLLGARVSVPSGGSVDSTGTVEIAAPAGQVEVTASNGDASIEVRRIVTVETGATASVEIVLKPSGEGR